MPVSGVMPMGIVLPARPSRVRWLPEVIFMLVVVCLLLLHGVRPASLVISSRYLWPWKRPLFLRSDLEATMVVENQLRRGNEVVWLDVFIWLWWSLVCRSSSFLAFLLHRLRGEEDGRKARWRDGFCRSGMSLFSPDFDAELRRSLFSSNRWAVSVNPATLRAEGQPCAGTASFARFVLPPGFKPSRRQFLFRLDAMAMSYGSLVAPSGPSPAATRRIPSGEDGPDCVFISQFEVLSVNAQGLVCSFFFLLGLVVICVILFFMNKV